MIRIACVGLLLGLSATALADGKRAPKPAVEEPAPGQDPNQCTKVEGSARFVGLAYTHSITLRNGCGRPVACTLWTDVDPEPKQSVQVKPGESVEVVTRRGSPARELTAFKECTFR
ncbi:MAG TPA: hypothetical protein VFX59_07365 [Polyangiales bacterium]|nr:hypothetical protein [Polyangiales bacterium]